MYEPNANEVEFLYTCDDIFNEENPRLRSLDNSDVVNLYREFSLLFSFERPGNEGKVKYFGLKDKGCWLVDEETGEPKIDLFVEFYSSTPHEMAMYEKRGRI